MINQPPHYTFSKFETIDIIADKLELDMYEGFLIGNVIKYTLRYRHKNGVEDLKKARWYLDKLIKSIYETPKLEDDEDVVVD